MNGIESVFDALRRADTGRPALIGRRTVIYGRLAGEVDAVTAGLQAAGMEPGDAVIFTVRPSIEAIVLILAIVRCGGVVVAADPGMSPELFSARIAPLRPRWVMTESVLYLLARVGPARSALERRGVRLPNFDVPGARRVLVGAGPGLTYSALAATRSAPQPCDVAPEAPAFVAFTSGTTAAPKGVIHSRRSISAGLDMVSGLLALRPDDRVYSDQLHMIVPALLAGATCLIRSGARGELERFQPTHAFWVPARLNAILDAGVPPSLRTIVFGSAPAPSGFLQRCVQFLPADSRVYIAYALTEMLPVAWVEMGEKLAFAGDGDLLGCPCPGVRLRIDDEGEIFASGPNLCTSYIGSPPMQEVATGDIGRFDGGRLVLMGRKKNMIIRGDLNIYPELIEGVAAGVPGVRRCAMVGLYQEQLADELAVLAVEPADGVDAATLEVRVRRALWEGPHRIDVAARPDLILTTRVPLQGRSSKVDRESLRALLRPKLAC